MFVPTGSSSPPGAEVANCPTDFSRDGFVAGQHLRIMKSQCKKDLRNRARTCNTQIHDVFVFATGICASIESIVYIFIYVCIYVTIFMYMHVMIKYDIYKYTYTYVHHINFHEIKYDIYGFHHIGPLMVDFRDHRSGGTRHSSLQHHCQRSAKSWARQPKGSKRNGRNPERLFGSIKKSPKTWEIWILME